MGSEAFEKLLGQLPFEKHPYFRLNKSFKKLNE